jgi:DNA-binding protein HU-beta
MFSGVFCDNIFTILVLIKKGARYMNKADLIAAIAEKAGITKADAEVAFSATFDVITEALMKQNKVAIPGFGGFSTKVREERKGRNPSTGKDIIIPKAIVASFKVAAQLKDSINNQEK